MASIFKRKLKDSKGFTWCAVIRIPEFPTTCKTFERTIKAGQFKFEIHKKQYTYADLMQRMEDVGCLNSNAPIKKLRRSSSIGRKTWVLCSDPHQPGTCQQRMPITF